MSTARLTTSIREALATSLLTRAYKDRGNDLIKRGFDFAQKIYDDALGKDLAQINALPDGWLPDGWLPTDDNITVQLGAEIKKVYFKGSLDNGNLPPIFQKSGIRGLEDQRWRRFPSKYKGAVVKQYPGDHALVGEFQKLDDEWKELRTEMERAGNTVMTATNAVSTVKKLIEVWPEVEEFAKHYLVNGEGKAVLPAITRDNLNAMLNLPPEEK